MSSDTIFTAGEMLDEEPAGSAPPIFTLAGDSDPREAPWAASGWETATSMEPGLRQHESYQDEAQAEDAEFEAAWLALDPAGPEQSFLTPAATPATFPSGLVLQVATGATGENQEHWDPTGTNLPLYATGASVRDKLVAANFTVGELVRSGSHHAEIARISVDLVRLLQAIRDRVGKGVGINSGYRSWFYNIELYKRLGKPVSKSPHCSGRAADIAVAGLVGMDLAKMAIEIWGDRIGVGISTSYAHVDVRDSFGSWTYLSGDAGTRAVAEINAFRDRWRASGAKPTIGAPRPVPSGAGSWIPAFPGTVAPAPVPPPPAAPAAGKPQPRDTTFLNSAWARYSCAEKDTVQQKVLSNTTAVNPLTVDAWAALARALTSTGYEATSTWSYVCRLIAGSTQRSLHSFGIALDIDPTLNPHLFNTVGPVRFSSQPTQAGRAADVLAKRADTVFTPAQVAAVEGIRTIDGMQVFAWGGRWRSSHDSMHFQIDLTPDELRRGIDARTVPGASPAREYESQEAGACRESLDEL